MEEQVQAMNLFNFDPDKFQMTVNNIPITIVGNYDSPWFAGKEICMGFGYKSIQDALYKRVKSKHKTALADLKKVQCDLHRTFLWQSCIHSILSFNKSL